MTDLLYDTEKRDIVIENGDFVFNTNPSVQNGNIILKAHVFSVQNPIYGVGLENVINGTLADLNFALNRWVSMCKSDGAKIAKATATLNNGQAVITTEIEY